ncbi:MAG: TIGR04222 domain-containing membrane protein [Pseudomonadota bacterium]
MPNPFLLTGFEFLLFYLTFGILVNGVLRHWIRQQEAQVEWHKQQMTDPYQIALLRGGDKEALRIATIALIDRGLLIATDDMLHTKNDAAIELVNRPIEKAILRHYLITGSADSIFASPRVLVPCEEYQTTLSQRGLIPDESIFQQRLTPTILAAAILLLVTGAKIMIAFSQGRHKVIFLILLTIVCCFGVFKAYKKPITGRGEALLDDLRRLFSGLRHRVRTIPAGGQTNEAALVAAIFGVGVLPASTFPFVNKLYPQKSDNSGSSGCGSSSNSGGSSCGGGGCGGGCGG